MKKHEVETLAALTLYGKTYVDRVHSLGHVLTQIHAIPVVFYLAVGRGLTTR